VHRNLSFKVDYMSQETPDTSAKTVVPLTTQSTSSELVLLVFMLETTLSNADNRNIIINAKIPSAQFYSPATNSTSRKCKRSSSVVSVIIVFFT
jgi:hypothetical protein